MSEGEGGVGGGGHKAVTTTIRPMMRHYFRLRGQHLKRDDKPGRVMTPIEEQAAGAEVIINEAFNGAESDPTITGRRMKRAIIGRKYEPMRR